MQENIFSEVFKDVDTSKIPKCHYVIGIDCTDKNNQSYCLVQYVGNKADRILLSKTIHNPYEFKEEIDNLIKYFNALLIYQI